MQLRRLRVRNIRSYESGAVEFAPGTTLLSGDVGAGKTSLLYAIEMALFGVAEVDAAYLVRHGTAHAETEVEFEDPTHRYRIARRFRRVRRRGKETFEPERISFRIDGSETTYSATELRQRVIELLGFPDNPNPQAHSDLWRWAVYVPQERMRDILGARPQERLETVRKALGVERYRIAAENALDHAADLRKSQRSRQAEAERMRHFDIDFAEATDAIDRWGLERRQRDVSIREREAGVEAARTAVNAAEETLRRSEADRRELESLEREQAEDRRRTDELERTRTDRLRDREERHRTGEEDAREASGLDAARGALRSAEARRTRGREAIDAHGVELRALSQAHAEEAAAARRVEDARSARAAAEREREVRALEAESAAREGPVREPPAPTPRSISEIEGELLRAQKEEAEALTRLARGQSALAELEELLRAGLCPRCHQAVRPEEFGPHRAEAAAETSRLEGLLHAASAARKKLEEERQARERYERARERWLEVEKRRELSRSALQRAEASWNGARSHEESAREAHARATERVAELAPAEREESRLRAELSASEEAFRDAGRLVERATAASERARAGAEATKALEEELGRLEADLLRSRERGSSREARMNALRQHLEDWEEKLRARTRAESSLAEARSSLESERVVAGRLEARIEEAARRLRAAEKGRAERAALVAEMDDLGRKAEWVSGPFREALLVMERKLLAHAQAAFERRFARYFASLIDDPALVARTDGTFTPGVTIEGEWTPAEALSGGERTSLALAFRLALAEVVRRLGSLKLDTILLDEPTDGFSPEQVVRMGELLDELGLPQVVIVSHEAELAGIADRVVRVSKEDGRSVLSPSAGPGPPEGPPPEQVAARRGRRTAARTAPLPPSGPAEGSTSGENP